MRTHSSLTNQIAMNFKKVKTVLRVIPVSVYAVFLGFLVVTITLAIMSIKKATPSPHKLIQTQLVLHQDATNQFAYDGRIKVPVWVLESFSPEALTKTIELSQVEFYEDDKVPNFIRSELSDYDSSGFVISPLFTATTQKKCPLSLVCPQVTAFNKTWVKLNNYFKELIKQTSSYKTTILTGPLYMPNKNNEIPCKTIGKNSIAVPTHFFKAIFYPVNPDGYKFVIKSEIYVLPNEDIPENVPLEAFKVTFQELERLSGIVFSETLEHELYENLDEPLIKL
jgi:endonuclease G, mitochondrial